MTLRGGAPLVIMGISHADAENAEKRLDSCEPATGLVRLSSVALASCTAEDGTFSSNSNSTTSANNNRNCSSSVSVAVDASLPSGWKRIIHGSGLPCYVHEELGVVCWTRPYPLGVGALPQSELHRLVKEHVPPLSTFTPAWDIAGRKHRSIPAPGPASSSTSATPDPKSIQTKKRKLDVAIKEEENGNQQQSMSLEDFKTLSISDPRVLQACLELSIKTPAQVLQEYLNRNRGVSINYNTMPVEGDGVKLFKTIVTAGSTVAEGVASTKKIAKQLGAQQLLAMLHERTAQRYHEVAEMYNNSLKGKPVTTESTTLGPTAPLRKDARDGRGNGGPHHLRGSDASNRMRRVRRSSLNQEYGESYRDYEVDRRGPRWNPCNQQPMQQAGVWNGESQQRDIGMDNACPERVVVYSTTPSGSVGDYGSGQYCANAYAGENSWSSYPDVNHPSQPNLAGVYAQQYIGSYGVAQPPPESRPYDNQYSSEPRNTSIECATANLRNQMSNQ